MLFISDLVLLYILRLLLILIFNNIDILHVYVNKGENSDSLTLI